MTDADGSQLIRPDELRALIAQDPDHVRVLDVRTGGEFEAGHIPGSYNVPLDTLPEHGAELVHATGTVVLVCQSGQRAQKADNALQRHGMRNIRVLQGGMNAWQTAGGTVNRVRDRWSLERQVRLVAGSIVWISILLSIAVPEIKWVAALIGLGLTVAAVTNTCAMALLLAKLPYNRRHDPCDIAGAVARITGSGRVEAR